MTYRGNINIVKSLFGLGIIVLGALACDDADTIGPQGHLTRYTSCNELDKAREVHTPEVLYA